MDFTQTTTGQLLALAGDSSDAAWQVFAERTRPVLQAVARRLGLSPEDADDVAQEALLECWTALRADGYRRERGRLRQFLIGITRNRAIDQLRRSDRTRGARGDSVIHVVPSSVDELEQLFEQEHRRKVLGDAMDALANRSGYTEVTLRAFERVHFDGLAPDDVARELAVTPQVVYNATSRCRRRLQELADELTDLYELN